MRGVFRLGDRPAARLRYSVGLEQAIATFSGTHSFPTGGAAPVVLGRCVFLHLLTNGRWPKESHRGDGGI
jgi:hypothetical protein